MLNEDIRSCISCRAPPGLAEDGFLTEFMSKSRTSCLHDLGILDRAPRVEREYQILGTLEHEFGTLVLMSEP